MQLDLHSTNATASSSSYPVSLILAPRQAGLDAALLREGDLEQRRVAAAADADRHLRRAAALDTERARLAWAGKLSEAALAEQARVWAAEELQLAAAVDGLSAAGAQVRNGLAVGGVEKEEEL
jgi:hypothetical protein